VIDIPSDNADMSNEKGFNPRLKLMVFISVSKFTKPKGLNDEKFNNQYWLFIKKV